MPLAAWHSNNRTDKQTKKQNFFIVKRQNTSSLSTVVEKMFLIVLLFQFNLFRLLSIRAFIEKLAECIDNLYSHKSSVEWNRQTENKTNNKSKLYKHKKHTKHKLQNVHERAYLQNKLNIIR